MASWSRRREQVVCGAKSSFTPGSIGSGMPRALQGLASTSASQRQRPGPVQTLMDGSRFSRYIEALSLDAACLSQNGTPIR